MDSGTDHDTGELLMTDAVDRRTMLDLCLFANNTSFFSNGVAVSSSFGQESFVNSTFEDIIRAVWRSFNPCPDRFFCFRLYACGELIGRR